MDVVIDGVPCGQRRPKTRKACLMIGPRVYNHPLQFSGLILGLTQETPTKVKVHGFFMKDGALGPGGFTVQNRFPDGDGRVPSYLPNGAIPQIARLLIHPFWNFREATHGRPLEAGPPPRLSANRTIAVPEGEAKDAFDALHRLDGSGFRDGLGGHSCGIDLMNTLATLIEQTTVFNHFPLKPKVVAALRQYKLRQEPLGSHSPTYKVEGHLYDGDGEQFTIPLTLPTT